MRLRWTVVVDDTGGPPSDGAGRPDGPRSIDVALECGRGTAVADVLGLLGALRACPSGDVRLQVDGAVQPDDALVGREPLVDGAVVRLRPAGAGGAGGAETTRPRRREVVPAGAGGPHLLDLVVVAGPDAGHRIPLTGRRLALGRAPVNDVTVADPRLSRRHCDLLVGTSGVSVVDLGPTIGTPAPDAGSGTGAGVRLALGDHHELGASVVALHRAPPRSRPASPPPSAMTEGTCVLPRSPRLGRPEQAPDVRLPAAPHGGRLTGFPLLAVTLPALAAVALSVWTGSAVYLLLAGLGPLLVAGGWLASRREARREGVVSRREHARACAQARERARRAADALATARVHAMPDAATLLAWCYDPPGRLWERSPDDADAVRVRLGRATDEDGPGSTTGPAPGFLPRVRLLDPAGDDEPVRSVDDLVSVDLADGALGVVEPEGPCSSARYLVGQLAALLPPTSLEVVGVLGDGARERWRWLHLLPHVPSGPAGAGDAGRAAREVAGLVRARSADERSSTGPPTLGRRLVLVVVDDPGGQLASEDLGWLAHAHRVGVHVVWVATAAARLPHGCASVVTPCSDDGVEVVVTRSADGSSARCVADRVGGWWSDRLARRLAPWRSTEPDRAAGLPHRVALADLLEISADAVAGRWRRPAAGLAVPLGRGPEGTVVVDLATVGPHALVAGTTGSGKSELLRSWLLALAACHPPSRVTFLLVDYKGGSTFDDLAELPHTVGLLTDLDGGATVRVLASLRAEVQRRERLLAGAGARDLDGYLALPGHETLPRLLVVVDEFRVLAEDAPDVLGEFVRLAATGRSLGVHLVLATQRPGGVVSADIRANTGLRVGLRMQDPGESRDVLDRPDAAWLDPAHPGRAVMVGPGLDVLVQTAWSGPTADDAAPSLTVLHPPDTSSPHRAGRDRGAGPGAEHGPRRAAGSRAGSSVGAAVASVQEAARLVGEPAAVPPWLPPLPVVLPRPDPAGDTPPGSSLPVDPEEPGRSLRLGVTDLPWRQERGVLVWDPCADGPALVLGGARSGRSTTLSTAAESAHRLGVPVLHLRAGDDEDHLVDVLTALAGAPGRGAAGSERDPHRPGGGTGLRLLLLLDDADELLDPAADPTAADELGRLLRAGHREGIGVLVAGGRALAGSRLASTARTRFVHRTTDPVDALVAGVPASAAARPAVPGRCLVVGLPGRGTGPGAQDGHPDAVDPVVEAQVFLPGEAPTGRDPARGPDRPAVPGWVPGRLPGGPEVTAHLTGTPGAVGLVVTSSGVAPWRPDLTSGGLLVVAGPPRSGRTSALSALSEAGRVAGAVARYLSDDLVRGPVGHLVQVLLVDDVDQADPALVAALEAWLEGRGGPLVGRLAPGATVVLTGSTDHFADGFRGLPLLVRRSGRGVVLHPGRTDVRDVLGTRDAPAQRSRGPGRGILVERGRAARVQLRPGDPERVGGPW